MPLVPRVVPMIHREMPHLNEWGPAMRSCTDRQREFVLALLDNGGKNSAEAARRSGYQGNSDSLKTTGWRLSHTPRVQEAMLEVAKQRIRTTGITAASYLAEVLSDDGAGRRDRMKAAQMLMDRQGLHAFSEHKTTVEHTLDRDAIMSRLTAVAEKLGLDPSTLIGSGKLKKPALVQIEEAEVVDDDLGDLFG